MYVDYYKILIFQNIRKWNITKFTDFLLAQIQLISECKSVKLNWIQV